MPEMDKDQAVDLLNRILEYELAGVVRYTHYSLLVFGYNRIPIGFIRTFGAAGWMRRPGSPYESAIFLEV